MTITMDAMVVSGGSFLCRSRWCRRVRCRSAVENGFCSGPRWRTPIIDIDGIYCSGWCRLLRNRLAFLPIPSVPARVNPDSGIVAGAAHVTLYGTGGTLGHIGCKEWGLREVFAPYVLGMC